MKESFIDFPKKEKFFPKLFLENKIEIKFKKNFEFKNEFDNPIKEIYKKNKDVDYKAKKGKFEWPLPSGVMPGSPTASIESFPVPSVTPTKLPVNQEPLQFSTTDIYAK